MHQIKKEHFEENSCLEIKQEIQNINTIYVNEENIDSVDSPNVQENQIRQEIFEEREVTPIEDPITIHVKQEKLDYSESKNETHEQKRNRKKQGAAEIKCNSDVRQKVLETKEFKDYLVGLGVSEPVNEKKKPATSVHEGAKPFKCNLCDYETGLNYNLKKHTEIVHEGLKPFKCRICDFKTGDKTNLKTHIDSVHEGIKPFKCNICVHESSTKGNLKRHIETVHERIKPFKCNFCDYESARKDNLNEHVESVHGMD
jgi:uncharacterized Zn-finger protein